VPDVKYLEKATEQDGHFDRMMVTLYSGVIAGLTLFLLRQQVCARAGGLLLVSLGMFVLGVGHTLLHITFHSKMQLLLEGLINRTEHVPNMLEREEPTGRAYGRMQAYAQRAYLGQLLYLFLGVVIASVAVVVHLWAYSWRAGVVPAILATFAFGGALAVRLWLKTVLDRSARRWAGPGQDGA
jgi:hypothetical protein